MPAGSTKSGPRAIHPRTPSTLTLQKSVCAHRLSRVCRRDHLTQSPEHARAVDKEGATVCHWCALSGNLQLLVLVHDTFGAPLDVPASSSGMLPLHWACTRGQLSVIEYLLSTGQCDINGLDVRQTTPVMVAAQYGHRSAIELLTRHGCDASLLDQDGDSAMGWAAYKGETGALEALHALGLRPELADAYGSTALHLAAGQGHEEAVRWLLAHESAPRMLTALDGKGRTPLQAARERGRRAVVHDIQVHLGLRPDTWLDDLMPGLGQQQDAMTEAALHWADSTGQWLQGAVRAMSQLTRGGGVPIVAVGEAERRESALQPAPDEDESPELL
jgi:ankyrin repeat protein